MSRPELSGPASSFYDAKEARKYDSSSRMISVQREITERAIELLKLPPDRPAHVLDVGCGSGLSGAVLEERGHVWVGCDISTDMLSVAAERPGGGDLIRRDMGSGLPFRAGTFDACVSISALQWLCYSNSRVEVPRRRLTRFFSSLYGILRKGGRAVLQFYPETAEQAVLISECAARVGFAGGIVVDYPNSAKAKKHYLVLTLDRGSSTPAALSEGALLSEARAKSVRVDELRRKKGKPIRRKKGVKTKEWIVNKKETNRRRGKETRVDSKYTARKRPTKF